MQKMIITDLDGTLLRDDQTVGQKDRESLVNLGRRGFLRVIATGRSPFSFSRVIPDDFPIDYLVFSSGAGVMNWKTKEILISRSITESKVKELALMFKNLDVDFKVLAPIPDNHHYVYFQNGEAHPDFIKRMEYYRGYEKKICFDPLNFDSASQFLIILPDDPSLYESLKDRCKGVKVVRATSPIDHKSIWMEIFHPLVSKAEGIKYLCKLLDIHADKTIAVGNDYNDLDMLAFAAKPYVVRNTPNSIKENYPVVSSNNENGFTDMLEKENILL